MFDPPGLISPFTLQGRMVLQAICKDKAEWNDPLEPSLQAQWNAWKSNMTEVEQIQVPRCTKPNDFEEVETTQLHTFSDASTTGYGQCSYVRMVDRAKRVHVAFLASKAKVTPIKAVTIPRLELQAACGAVRLAKKIQNELGLLNVTNYFYTDSTVLLGYITNTKERYQTYVSDRVETIRSLSEPTAESMCPLTKIRQI